MNGDIHHDLWRACIEAWGIQAEISNMEFEDFLRLALGITSHTSIMAHKKSMRSKGYIDYPEGLTGRAGKTITILSAPRSNGSSGVGKAVDAFRV